MRKRLALERASSFFCQTTQARRKTRDFSTGLLPDRGSMRREGGSFTQAHLVPAIWFRTRSAAAAACEYGS